MDLQVSINYYARQGLFRHIQLMCGSSLKKRGDDVSIMFWLAFGKALAGDLSEAIRDYENVRLKARDLNLAVLVAMMHAYKRFKIVDQAKVDDLSTQMVVAEMNSTERAWLLASMFLMHTGEYTTARNYASKVLEIQPNSTAAAVTRGWIDLLCGREAQSSKADQYFLRVLAEAQDKPDLEALLGAAKYCEMTSQPLKALEYLNQALEQHSWFVPTHIEKARVLLAMGDWEAAREAAENALAVQKNNVEAQSIDVLYILARSGLPNEAADKINTLFNTHTHITSHTPRACACLLSFLF
eukprot:gnl/Hemi2/1906_TR679_c0_g1_i1.p1 gnl/Hemi2/1906_TR679_c0_g1~~gnl/Hemi2/1906_TR679_c0_g1_i1.p1  ORF type:complete len:298 (+),score=99.16 gnl/Hemi2/1906_TR679_c0_g1_i1:70-963(+)